MTRESLKISIVIPCFNAGPFLAATLQSIVDQNARNVEVVIADGGSDDDTLDVARAFSSLPIRIVSEPDRGQLDAVHKGLGLATGDILLWLNADDLVMPGAFDEVRAIFARRQVDFVYSDDVAFDEDRKGLYYGATIRGLKDYDHFLFYRQMYSECVYWRREITRTLPDETFRFRVYTDYAFFLRLRWGRRGYWSKRRLGAFRIREMQASQAHSARKRREYLDIKAMHREYIGMSETRFSVLKILYAPYFFIRHVLVPQARRGVRKVWRKLTRDRARTAEARFFFEQWLLPGNSKGPR